MRCYPTFKWVVPFLQKVVDKPIFILYTIHIQIKESL